MEHQMFHQSFFFK
ncbi:hypothetical protein EE612_059894 [Oryza sativa]|nr:hypothetical protein EE612_059894 [Oryza sativa]